MKDNTYNENGGRIISWFLAINIINIFIKQNIDTKFVDNYLTIILGVIYLFFFLIYYRTIVKDTLATMMVMEVIIVMMVAFSFIRYPEVISRVIGRYIWTVLFCVPFAVIVGRSTDLDKLMERTEASHILCDILVGASFLEIVIKGDRFTSDNYNMPLAYTLLFPFLWHVSRAKEKHIYVLISSIEFIIILIYGSRGPILCIMVYCFFKVARLSSRWKLFIVNGMIILSAIVFLYRDAIATKLASFYAVKGGRSIGMLVGGRILFDGGRFDIWKSTIEQIVKKPILGWGFGGELIIMSTYPHNVFLELLLHFGLIIGGFVCLWLIFLMLKRYVIKKQYGDTELVLFCAGFFPLLLSGTYTNSPLAWAWAAYFLKNRNR